MSIQIGELVCNVTVALGRPPGSADVVQRQTDNSRAEPPSQPAIQTGRTEASGSLVDPAELAARVLRHMHDQLTLDRERSQ